MVGRAALAGGIYYAFLYSNGEITDLNTLLPANSDWELSEAWDINDAGQIVGAGIYNEQTRAFLLTPTSALAAPSDLTVISCLPGELRLRWRDNSANETGWIIERRTADGPWTELRRLTTAETTRFPGGTDMAFFDTGLTRNTAYTYRVRAADGVTVSDPSNEEQATTLDVAPITPTTLNAFKKGKAVRVGEWGMTAQVTEHDGLAVHRVTMNKQQLVAEQISVPFFDLWLGEGPQPTRCELKPESPSACQQGGRSKLLSVEAGGRPNLSIRAVYSVDKVAPDTHSCLLVTQQYDFFAEVDAAHDPHAACEGSQTVFPGVPFHHPEAPCARFTPSVAYQFLPDTAVLVETFKIELAERLQFQNWALRQNVLTIFQDCDKADFLSCLQQLIPIAIPVEGNPLNHEYYLANVIKDGKKGTADNIHQTFNKKVEPPGGDLGGAYAGCPECIHLHWRWSDWLYNENFNFGRPLLDPGSTQSVDLAVVNKGASAEAEDPSSDPPSGPPLETPVVWLLARSTGLSDTFFAYDGFVFPATDLAVTATRLPSPARVGEVLTYNVEVMNRGPAPSAPEVTLEVNMSGVALADIVATPSKGNCDPRNAFSQLCQLGTLARGEKVTVTIANQALQAGQVVSNFTVHGLRPDQSIQNNTVQRQIRVR